MRLEGKVLLQSAWCVFYTRYSIISLVLTCEKQISSWLCNHTLNNTGLDNNIERIRGE